MIILFGALLWLTSSLLSSSTQPLVFRVTVNCVRHAPRGNHAVIQSQFPVTPIVLEILQFPRGKQNCKHQVSETSGTQRSPVAPIAPNGHLHNKAHSTRTATTRQQPPHTAIAVQTLRPESLEEERYASYTTTLTNSIATTYKHALSAPLRIALESRQLNPRASQSLLEYEPCSNELRPPTQTIR